MNPLRASLAALCAAALLAAVGCDVLESDPANDPPIITAVAFDPVSTQPDSLVAVSVSARDPESSPLGYAWTASAGDFPDGAAAAAVAWRAPSVEGPCTLTVDVDDGHDATRASAVIEVHSGTPGFDASPDTLDFGGELTSLPLTVRNSGTVDLSWLAAPRNGWIGLDPAAGVLSAGESTAITVSIERNGEAGPRTGRVILTTNAGFDTIHVLAEVPADPHLWALAERQHFGLVTQRLPVGIANIGNGGVVEWTATSNQSWFTLSAESGVTGAEPDTLWVEVDRTTLPLGETSYATLRITDAENDVRTILFRANKVAEQARGFVEIARYPHDPNAFTQGLEWLDGEMIEGTGLNGESTLRRVDLETGIAQQSVALGPEVFGEGLTVWNDRILQLTWLAQEAYVWDATTFAPLDTLTYPTQGWGLTHDADRLIMSDGSATLYFRDPLDFTELGRVAVTTGLEPLNRLNELEWIDGLVWANVWLTDYIVRIDPVTGLVVDWLDLTGLLPPEMADAANVLNGIAWDAANERLFVTGKDWPLLFEIEPRPFD